MKPDGRLAVSLLMLAIFIFFVGPSLAFRPEARTMPLLVGIPAILLCLLQIVLDLKRRSRITLKSAILLAEERPIAMWLLLFLLGIVAFGFTFGAPPLVAAYLYFAARETLLIAVAGGAFCVFILSFIFERMLYVQLFEGLITPLVF